MSADRQASRARVSARRQAFNNVLDFLEYRVAVRRAAVERWERESGVQSRAAATERSAAMEAELIMRELREMALKPRSSREARAQAEKRALFVAERRAVKQAEVADDR